MSEFTLSQVGAHNKEDDCWIVIDNKVYDVTKFLKMHPGGKGSILEYAGRDATKAFYSYHRHEVLAKYGPRLKVGTLEGKKPNFEVVPGTISQVPFAEVSFWRGWKSPYYNDSHVKFRAAVRKFYDEHVMPKAEMWNTMGKEPSKALYKKFGEAGLWAARIGPGRHMKGLTLIGGIKGEDFDFFHEGIAHEESARVGTPGLADGLGAGLCIGLPPVLHFAKKALADKVIPEVLSGEKCICLAITEPVAGSDVANIQTTAKLSPCGKFYIVNGMKKWITGGNFSDYFTTAVRTGGKGIGGISLLLIDRSMGGVTTKKIKTSYSPSAGTCWVFFENAKVPVENLLGKENQGFRCIMANFNHERWMIIVGVVRACRSVVEECIKWANQRMVFGKPLIAQPVIRQKLGSMIAQVEAVSNWTENVTYQMCKMTYKEQTVHLAGPTALLKYQSTRVSLSLADQACQIFGGRAITRTGMGRIIEGFQRSAKFGAILGGSEEIMADLGVRQAMKYFPKNARL